MRKSTVPFVFAATIPDAAYQAIRMNPTVEYIEPDLTVSLSATTQSNATWGLDRVDQRDLPLSGSYGYERTGSGVYAFIIDTGISHAHTYPRAFADTHPKRIQHKLRKHLDCDGDADGSPDATTTGTWSTRAPGECTILAGKTSCAFSLDGIRKNVGSVSYTDSNGLGTVTITKP